MSVTNNSLTTTTTSNLTSITKGIKERKQREYGKTIEVAFVESKEDQLNSVISLLFFFFSLI